jgi:UDP-glucose 4-epimerase
MSTLRADVVGADGFIGRHLAAALSASGARVTACTRAHQPYRPDAPDIVFYLASSITPALAEQHPDWVGADHQLFAAVLRRLARRPNPPTVVLTSSAGTAYDPDVPGPWREDDPTRATNGYGAAKLALERLLLEHSGIPAVVLRLSNVYGPGQRVDKSQGVLAYWLGAAAADRPLQVMGDPQARRDYVYIHDVVDCLLRVAAWSPTLAASEPPLVVNVASGTSTSLADLLSTVELVVGRDLTVQQLPGRAVDRRDTSLDVRRAAQCFGWRPRTSLVDGITQMWQSLRPEGASTGAGLRESTLQA